MTSSIPGSIPGRTIPAPTRRIAIMLGLALITIAFGLLLRFAGPRLGLPAPFVKYGGSVVWGTMVLFLVAGVRPRLSRSRLALIAVAIAVIVELIRLLHTPWLDDFRLTLAGALLLGRIFSVWNIVAYVAGIVVGVVIDRAVSSTSDL